MSFQINTDQQRIEASGSKATGNWTNATYSRTAAGVGNIVSVAHGIIGTEKLYLDFTSGGEVDGEFVVTKVDDDNLSFVGSANSVITAGAGVAYKRVRSLSIQGDESLEISVGTGALEKDAIYIDKNAQENVRVGINTNDPQFELDVEGQIRTTRSIISDTAQVTNLDIDTIINPALNLRAPNLINFEDTDVTSPTFGTTFFPTADTPPLSDQSRRVATTDFVYKVATNDTGGRVYVSQTIGSDLNDGRSAARPVKTVKKAAQIAYGLQKATPDPTDEYVTIIVSGGEYLEDNPISLPRNCSLVGDNLRRVILRPQNQDRHMIKASNETYIFGVVFRDALQNASDPQSTVIHTWKYAFVFDDKQRLYYEPEISQIPAVPGNKFRGDNIFKVTFNNHTGSNTTLQVGYFVQGGSSGTQGTVQAVNFTGPQASPYSTGDVTILVTSGVSDVFQDAEKVFYDATSLANIITDINNPSVSDRFDVVDAESLRPELETISNQIYQHTVDTERETVSFRGSTNYIDVTLNRITITGHGFVTGDNVVYDKDENTNPLPGLIDTTRYWVRKVDDNTIELYDLEANAIAATSVTQGIKDLTGVSPDDKFHQLTTGNVMPEDNHIYITNHQYTTGDGVIYRQGKMGGIGGLVDGTAYFVYKESDNWFRLASSAANATQKDASGADNPVTLPITSTGLGFQRFELQNKLLSITSIDTSTNTIATYQGPIFTLASSSLSSDFHDYEVGQEVNIYGFQNSAINFGTGTNSAYTISGGLITIQITNVDNTLTSAFFGNMQTLGQAGVTFNFPGADDRFSKTYLIGNWSTGSGTPTLPGNTDLGLGYGRYNSSNTTITFVLKQANIDTASDVTTSSGSNVSVLDNVADLNGRKYITHRIERADGYSLQFVVRANISQIGTAIDPTGNQTVVGSNNYVLASLRNSPYGFSKINISDRFRDGAENIKRNQEFIAEEAVAYVKYYYESSATRGTALTIGGTNFGQVASTVARGITSWAVTGDKCKIKVQKGHNLYPSFSQHTPSTATYTASSGNVVVTINSHNFEVGDLIKFDPGALVFRCSMDDYSTLHAYPRPSDPAADKWLKITAKTTNTFTVNVGTSPTVNHQVSDATYDPSSGLMTLTIGNHTLTAGTSIKMPVGAVTFSCAFGGGGQVNKSYPRSEFINPGGQVTNAAYNPTTGIMTVTTTNAHGLQNGNKIKLEQDSFTFTCTHGSGNKTYPRSTDPLNDRNIPVFNVTTNTFDIQTLDVVPSTNTTPHTFVSATATAVQKKKDAKIYDEAVRIESVTPTTITVQTLENTPSTNTDVHTFISAATNAVVSGGNYTHQFASAGTNSVKKALTSSVTITNSGNATVNGTHGIFDIYDDREFTIDLTDSSADTQTGSAGEFTDNQQPFRTPNSKDQGNKYGDVSELLFANADMIADYAVNKMLAANPSYTIPTGNTACYDDVRDFIQKCVAHNLKWGGNDRVYDQAKFYIDPGFSLTRDRYAEVFGYAKDAAILTGRNLPLYRNPYSTKLQYYHLATLDVGAGTVRRDAATLIQNNLDFIANEAVQRYEFDNPGHRIPGANQNCVDDALDVLRAVTYNLAYGGNEQVFDAANLYVGSTFLDGEETESRAVFQIVKTLARTVAVSDSVGTIEGNHGYTQVIDNTNKGTTVEQGIIDGFFEIVDLAIANDNMSHATRTVATNPSCANVISAITTFFDTVTTAIGSGSTAGNVTGVVRTSSPGDQQCIDDTMKILRAFQYDLRYGGNQKTVEAANLYISGASGVQHVTTEVTYTRAIFAAAKELAIDAIRNNLEQGQFSQILPEANGSITVDSSAPECANVVSALVTNWGILDNVLSSGNSYSGTVTNPDPLIVEQDQSSYSFPLVNTFLDLPVIEASPYIQNSSLISFLGGSGCEIDGAKVATPNVPRPGLKQNAQGATVAQFDPQGKSMVANAFTIICFGGTAYNVSNDGYTQLVSVFAIFCQDGILTQSGGYASVTNSASNFGTYSLRATGFRAEAYSFDVGVIDSITDDVDGNGVATGRQVIQVSGTTLTGVPVEDYIIKIDGYTSTDPAVEHIILETELISGAPGTQIVAKISTNRAMDYSQGGNRYQSSNDPSFAAGSLPLSNLVGSTIRFHRPSVTNSSSHTWEYAGSGNTYAALPQNGGVGQGSAFEAAEESFGQVYTSGTNEFGDFKVGNFVTIFNRTGAISFVGTVSISELSSIKIVGGDITITGFSQDDNLGGTFASDSLLPTQASVRDYISNNLGPYLNQPYSTNAVPSALVQLTSSGKINIDQIPALRPFNITSVASTAERLAIEDANAGDIAIETTATTFSVANASFNLSNDNITIASHGVNTGDLLTYTQGSSPIGNLATNNNYYAIKVDDNTIQLASTDSNAQSGNQIDLTTGGAGTHTLKTQGVAISYILENDLESQFLAFAPNSAVQFTNGDIIVGSSTTARGVVTAYNDGQIFNFVISTAGTGYTGDFSLTISAPSAGGTQAAATANVVNGSVTKVTITNPGSKYYTQPTISVTPPGSGTTAVIAAQIEARVSIDIANNIKFDAGDFILDQANANEGTGTYSQSGTTITITENNHGLSNAALVYLDFTSGGASDGFYTISLINGNQYSVTSASSGTNSGNMARKRILDLTRVINTSATNAANWTQLTSTNIDASNIVAGIVDPERLAGKGAANSFSFLRGDSSWEYALQSIRPTTQDAIVIGGSLSDSSYIDSITITNGGTGYTNGTYQNIPMDGGNISISSDNVARATYIVSGGTITSATVTDAGTGYTGDFSVTIPSELGGGTGAILNATKGIINRAFGNIEIDIRKGNALTSSALVYGNYGVFRFRKDVTNQAVGNQDQGGFIIDNTGSVAIDQGPGSELNADRLDGNQGVFYQDAGNLTQGTLDPARLLNTTYAISISGTADTANLIFNETASLTSNPSPSQAGSGVGAALRNNNADGLTDGGTTHGVITYRRQATGNAATQLGFTDNNNLYIRGNSGNAAVYSNWFKIWSASNDGAGSGLDADIMDGKQGLWYQTGYNIGDTRGGINAPIGDMFLPEVLGQDKIVFENLYVNDTGNKFTLYIPDFHCNSGVGGNINNGGVYTIYSDVGATNNIGSIQVDSSGGVQEKTHTTGEIYSLVTGTIAFVGANTNANIYVFGPNPGTKWTVSSSNKVSGGSTSIFGLRDNANGAKLQIGKASTSTTPTIDFRSGGQAPNYDVQMIVSGGNTSDGNGTIRFNAADFTFNGNTVWHSGNDGITSQLDAHYLDGYTQNTAAVANTIARRDASGHLTVNDLTADQGIFSNSGAGTLSLADANGITLGKATTNVLAIQGKQSSTIGKIRFGNDTNDFGWDGTKLSYNGVHFRNSRLGVGQNDPQVEFHVGRNASASSTLGSAPARIMLEQTNNTNWSGGEAAGEILWKKGDDIFSAIRGEHTRSGGPHSFEDGGLSFWTAPAAETPTATKKMILTSEGVLAINTNPSNSTTYLLTVSGKIHSDNQLVSTVATGTAPLAVTSTTMVDNLNADMLDGYEALSLPYLGGSVNQWISDDGGQERFYFANNAATYFRTGTDYYFRNNGNSGIGSLNDNGCWTFYSGSDQVQSTYGLEVRQLNGINLNASEGLSSGQKSTVLRAGGDKQWIDSYGVFKRNRQTVAENITVASTDNCMTAGPITINNGTTITISNGGSWSVV